MANTNNFKRFVNGLCLRPIDSNPNPKDETGINVSGAVWVYANKIKAYLDGSIREIITANQTQTLTNKTATSLVLNTAVSGTAVLDEDDLASDSATQIATQQSIKAYVDAQVTAQDLDTAGDSGTGAVDLDSQSLTVSGGNGIDTVAADQAITITADIATGANITASTANKLVDASSVINEDNMASDSDEKIPTQQSVKAYVDAQVTAQDLDLAGDSGTGTVDLDSQSLTIAGGTGLDSVAGSQTVTLNIDSTVATLTGSQTITNKTIDADNNTISNIGNEEIKAGVDAVKLADGSVTNTELQYINTLSSNAQDQLDSKIGVNATDSTFTIDDVSDPTKQINFDAAGTTSTKTTITSSQTTNRVITLPDATDTLVGKATTDTLTNKTLTTIGFAGETLESLATGTANNSTIPTLGYIDDYTTVKVATTKGDLIHNNASNVTARLPIGTEDQILTVTSGVPAWEDVGGNSSGDILTTDDAQTITNKDIDGGTMSNTNRITLPKGTTAGLGALTDKEATLAYDTDLDTIVINDGSAWNEISGGAGGAGDADVFETINGDDGITDWDTTNITNATFVSNTTTPLNGDADFKMGNVTGSVDEYVTTEDITVPLKSRGRMLGVELAYSYDGDDNDISVELYDVTNSVSLGETYLEAGTAKRLKVFGFSQTSTVLVKAIYTIKVVNNGKFFYSDDIVFSGNPAPVVELIDRQSYRIEQTALSTTSYNQEIQYNLATATILNEDSNIISVTDDAAGSRTKFTALRDCYVVIDFTCEANIGVYTYIWRNGVLDMKGASSYTATAGTPVGANFKMTAGEYFSVGSASTSVTGAVVVEFTAQATSEGVVHTNGDYISTVTKYLSANVTVNGDISDLQFDDLVIGKEYEISGNIQVDALSSLTTTVDFRSAASGAGTLYGTAYKYNFAGSDGICTKFTATSTSLYVNGSTISRVDGDGTKGETFLQLREVLDARTIITPLTQTAYIKNIQTSGTGGGSATANTIQTVTLNTASGDTNIVNLSANQFTLGAGKYEIEIESPSYKTDNHQAFLYNVSDTNYDIDGSSEYASNGDATGNKSIIKGIIEITSSKVYELRHWTSTTRASDGLGHVAYTGINPQSTEVHAQIKITKLK